MLQGELAHREVKEHFHGTNRVRYVKQIAIRVERERVARQIALPTPQPAAKQRGNHKSVQHRRRGAVERLPKGDPRQRYQMSDRVDDPIDIHSWLRENRGDPALSVSPA
jgi:hypothetical protein